MTIQGANLLELTVERPAAGGRMIARHEGMVVFVAGAIPGERVKVRVERRARQLMWATVVDVLDGSHDRRAAAADPACGGLAYDHIAYERQLALKSEVISDAFRRIGRIQLESPVPVKPSPEAGYRLRARFHMAGRRPVFYREGTHQPCDPASTRQLSDVAIDALGRATDSLESRLSDCHAMALAENVAGTERVLHLEPRDGARFDDMAGRVALSEGLTGLTVGTRGRPLLLAGGPVVTDTSEALFGGESPVGDTASWRRHATSFFQGNRFLTGALVREVLAAGEGDRVVDLYAGVGLFSVALAARGAEVVAVEGDHSAAADLEANAGPWPRLHVVRAAVERVVETGPEQPPDIVVLDPPRTGVSAEALAGIVGWRAPRLVYVSCDPPTLARDTARLAASGYRLGTLAGFDLFPATPHVETVAVFDRA